MFEVFQKLHNERKSDSVPYYSFYDNEGNLIKGEIEVSVEEDGQFGILTTIYQGETIIYPAGTYTYVTECLYVVGIGLIIPGDLVKLKINDLKKYELNFGWHTNISGQNIYSWYLVPVEQEDYFYETRKGIYNSVDLVDMNIESKQILTFYKEYLDTIEVVEFKKERVSFNVI